MKFASFRKNGTGVGTVALIAVLMACSDTPVGPGSSSSVVAFDQTTKTGGLKKPSLHYARVRSDGVLVDGTAVSATRLGEGSYRVTFPPGIGACAATANSSSFQGFDLSTFRTMIQIGIGSGPGGVFDDESVTVNVFEPSNGAAEDTSFSLVLVCP